MLSSCPVFAAILIMLPIFQPPIVSSKAADTPTTTEKQKDLRKRFPVYGGSVHLVDLAREKAIKQQEITFKECISLKESGQLKEAEQALNKLLADSGLYASFQPRIFAELAPLYATMGEWGNSVKTYRALVYVKPNQAWLSSRTNDAKTRLQFALALYKIGQYEEARVNYNYGAELSHPENYQLPALPQVGLEQANSVRLPILVHLGITQSLFSYSAEAVEEAQKAVRLAPNFGLSYLYLGRALEWNGKSGSPDRKAALDKAVQFGTAEVKSIAEKSMKKRY